MIALIIIGIILLTFLLSLSLKVTLTVAYHEEVTLSAKVWLLRFALFPKKQRKGRRSMSAAQAERFRKKQAKKAAKEKQKEAEQTVTHAKKKKKTLSEILDTISLATRLVESVVRRLRKHLRIDVARLKVTVASDDAATTAVAYGAITQSVNLLFPLLEQVKNFRLPNANELSVDLDFLSDTPEIDLKLSFSLRVWHLLDIGLGALLTFLKHLFKKQKEQ